MEETWEGNPTKKPQAASLRLDNFSTLLFQLLHFYLKMLVIIIERLEKSVYNLTFCANSESRNDWIHDRLNHDLPEPQHKQ